MRGKLINLEGISGIGKTYYSTLLRQCLGVEDVLFHKEIMDEKHKGINKKIFDILLSTGSKFFETGNPKMETLLIAAKQANDEENAIIPALMDGKTVISDRGLDSICIYQGILFARKYGGDPLNYTLKLYDTLKPFCLIPDKTILFTGNPGNAIKRAENRDSNGYNDSDLKILYTADRLYKEIALRNPERFVTLNVDEQSSQQIVTRIKIELQNFDKHRGTENERTF